MAAHERILDQDYSCSPPDLIAEYYDDQSAQCSTDNSEQNEKRPYNYIMRSKTKDLICEYCKKQFKYPSKYKEHLRVHTGEKPFPCSYCPLMFTQRGAQKNHEKLHINQKEFHQCPVCEAMLRNQKQLQKHMKTHDPGSNVILKESIEDNPTVIFAEQIPVNNEPILIGEGTIGPENIQIIPEEIYCEQGYQDEFVYADSGHIEITNEWQVDHVSQRLDPSSAPAESELHINRLADGRLLVNNVIVEGEHYPADGVTIYNYVLSNGQTIMFLYDEENDSLEIVERNDDYQEDVPSNAIETQTFPIEIIDGNYIENSNNNQEFYIAEEIVDDCTVDPSSVAEDYEKSKLIIVKPDPERLEPPLRLEDGSVLADMRPPKSGRTLEDAPLIPVSERVLKLAAPMKDLNSKKRKRFRKPQNLEWIINAIAKGQDLKEITPHKRKLPTVKVCEYCGLHLKYPSKILNHMRTHTGEKPFECEICNQKFALNTTLRMHLRRHLKQKMFSCTHPGCKKSFISGALLTHHIKVRHQKRRKFACLKGCGSSFYSNKERLKHEKECNVMDLENPIYEFPKDDDIIYAEEDKYYYYDDEGNIIEPWQEIQIIDGDESTIYCQQ